MLHPAVFAVLFSFSIPVFCAEAPAVFENRQAAQEMPVFTRSERSAAKSNPDYYTINPKSVKITLIETTEEPDMQYVQLQEATSKDAASTLVLLDGIVNTASKAWQIVQGNAPVVNINTKYATAYPQGVTSASQLAQWNRPKTYSYGFYAENLYGSVMINCKYKVSYSYGGTYKGKGAYLTGVTVIPNVASVAWGYKFYMSASVPDSTIANVGTDTDPIAALQLNLNWKMATVLKEVDGASVYYVQGNGYFNEIASPWRQAPEAGNIEAAAPLQEPEKVF